MSEVRLISDWTLLYRGPTLLATVFAAAWAGNSIVVIPKIGISPAKIEDIK